MVMIEVCSENLGWSMSPRISFSYDIPTSENVTTDQRLDITMLDNLSSDFDFGITEALEQESSTADELFAEGKILPLQLKEKRKENHEENIKIDKSYLLLNENRKKESLKEILENTEIDEKPATKSFWKFKRSNSLNCGSNYKAGFICNLSLLSRSKSTGSTSATNSKCSGVKSLNRASSMANDSKSSCSYQKLPPLKTKDCNGKTPYGIYGNGLRTKPILNFPPPYISAGTTNLFGLGYLFQHGKDKNKKKPVSS